MNDPAFLFYPGDYLRDTQCLSMAAQVAYDRIMCEHMRNICITKQQLNFFTKKLSDDEKEEIMMVLTEVEGGYQIKWIADSIMKRRTYSESRRNNRKGKDSSQDTSMNAISDTYDEDMNDISHTYDQDKKTYDEHMENENEIENINGNKIENKIEIEVFDLKKEKSEFAKKAKKLTQNYGLLVEVVNDFNKICKSRYQPNPSLYSNFEYWIKIYEIDEIKKAIENIPRSKWWRENGTPTVLFRRRNPAGENVDHIGALLNTREQTNQNRQQNDVVGAAMHYLAGKI